MNTTTKHNENGAPAVLPVDLRDYFAGQALANGNIEEHSGPQWADRVAEQAYKIADAMLKARKQ